MSKQISDLTSTATIAKNDLLVVRQVNDGVDRKIQLQNFIQSIGSSAVTGFTATGANNAIVLTPSNNALVADYVNGMKVSFLAPFNNDTTSAITIEINGLGSVPFYQLNTTQNVYFLQSEFVEAIFVDNAFYRVNDFKQQQFSYSNEYKVIFNDIENLTTTISLISAYGIAKQQYYEGMILTFICTCNTQGAVLIKIDGLGLVPLLDSVDGVTGDVVTDDLYENQIVQAIYHPLGFFKRNVFTASNPAVYGLVDGDIITDNTGQIIAINRVMPLENIREFVVGGGGGAFATLSDAFKHILTIENYKNYQFNIKINKTLSITADWFYLTNVDFSNVFLYNDDNLIICDTELPTGYIGKSCFSFAKSTCFNFKQNTTLQILYSQGVTPTSPIFLIFDSVINITDLNIVTDSNGYHDSFGLSFGRSICNFNNIIYTAPNLNAWKPFWHQKSNNGGYASITASNITINQPSQSGTFVFQIAGVTSQLTSVSLDNIVTTYDIVLRIDATKDFKKVVNALSINVQNIDTQKKYTVDYGTYTTYDITTNQNAPWGTYNYLI